MITIIVALALLAQPTPPLTATWQTPKIARVSWSGAGCLWKDRTFIRCYDSDGVLLLGGAGPLDAAYRPATGDVFRYVRANGSEERATLAWRVYVAAWR